MVMDSFNSPPIRFKVTPGRIFFMLLGNTLIALFMTGLHSESRFLTSFVYSQCMGISIATCVIFVVNYFKVSTLTVQTILVIAAIVVGIGIGVTAGLSAVNFIWSPDSSIWRPEKLKSQAPNLLYSLLFGAIVSYVFISVQKMSDEKIRRLEVEKNAAITEIKLLQSQMEPHFLFNTLSNILSLIDGDPRKARNMLEAFTAFLRASLVTARSETITVSQEMDVVKNYLEIFRMRMGDRLRYSIEIPESLQSLRIPPLLIQPLVENAVKHGLEPSVSGGNLLIRAGKDGDRMRIMVTDSGIGINELSPGNGIGLENIRKRLDLLYQGRSRISFEENQPSGVRVAIEIPYETNTCDHSG